MSELSEDLIRRAKGRADETLNSLKVLDELIEKASKEACEYGSKCMLEMSKGEACVLCGLPKRHRRL